MGCGVMMLQERNMWKETLEMFAQQVYVLGLNMSFILGFMGFMNFGKESVAFASVNEGDTTTFVKYAESAIKLFRFVGVFIVTGGIISAGIQYMQGDAHQSKGILAKTGVAAIVVLIAPTLMQLAVGAITGTITLDAAK